MRASAIRTAVALALNAHGLAFVLIFCFGGHQAFWAPGGWRAAMETEYQDRLTRFQENLGAEELLSRRLGFARFGLFCFGFFCYVGMDVGPGASALAFGWGLALSVVVFLGLVVWHRKVRARLRWARTLVGINEAAISRLGRDWTALPPTEMESPDRQHPYATDLDVSGETSLFRLFTTVTLPPGVATLRRWLLAPAVPAEIRDRQEAVEDLSGRLDFRQTLEGKGRILESPDPESIRRFLEWAEEDPFIPTRRWILAIARLLPLLTSALFLASWAGWVSGPWWLLGLAFGFVFGTQFRSAIHPLMEKASGGQERFGRYAEVLKLLLEAPLEAPALTELQEAVRSSPVGAERELHRLARRVAWSDVRFSPMAHAPLQALFAWDIHALAWLEGWKSRSGPHVRAWLESLGTLEALSALASLRGDHPDWSFPEVRDGVAPVLRAEELGHPLLPPASCVRNDVHIGPPGSFLFVTGSNMSGKSTLLRAVGINTVLAQAGGVVCAKSMELSPLRVQTSMRTADSLAEGVSQYMAELNRIRKVVGGARTNDFGMVLYLLDEPLQGTNEAERRVAVQTILGHLLDARAIGAVATHDLQLDDTPRLAEAARAVHLEGTVREGLEGPLISFDYMLKPGRATSTNALALLRAVGLGETVG